MLLDSFCGKNGVTWKRPNASRNCIDALLDINGNFHFTFLSLHRVNVISWRHSCRYLSSKTLSRFAQERLHAERYKILVTNKSQAWLVRTALIQGLNRYSIKFTTRGNQVQTLLVLCLSTGVWTIGLVLQVSLIKLLHQGWKYSLLSYESFTGAISVCDGFAWNLS